MQHHPPCGRRSLQRASISTLVALAASALFGGCGSEPAEATPLTESQTIGDGVSRDETEGRLAAPERSDALGHALAGHALGIGVALGAPSRLQLEAAAGEYTYGLAPAVADGAPPAPLPDDPAARDVPRRMQVGGGAQLRLGVASSRVRITAPDSPAGVRLAPVAGPGGFASWGPGVASGEAVVYASPDGQAAVVQSASAKGLKEDIVLTRSLGDALRFTWDLELDEGLEARLGDDGSIGIYGAPGVLAGAIEIGDDKSRALLDNAR